MLNSLIAASLESPSGGGLIIGAVLIAVALVPRKSKSMSQAQEILK